MTRLALRDTSIRARDRAARDRAASTASATALLATDRDPAQRGDAAIVGRIRDMTERPGPAVFIRQNGIARRDWRLDAGPRADRRARAPPQARSRFIAEASW